MLPKSPFPVRRWLLVVVSGVVLVGCTRNEKEVPAPAPASAPAAASAPGAESPAATPEASASSVRTSGLPAGVLAEADGAAGPIRVEERDGYRYLTIAGEVQGAARVEPGAATEDRDPFVDLLRALRPQAKTALVIGLGTGRTAADLSAAGLEVTVVEREAAVVALARSHFGYQGAAVVSDGLAYLSANEHTFDVLLMDAYSERRPPDHLLAPDAVKLLRQRTAERGVTAIRLLAEPGSELVSRTRRALGEHKGYARCVYGNGVGAEKQTLYLVASNGALNLVKVDGMPLWPVEPAAGGAPPWASPIAVAGGEPGGGATRTIAVVGYLIVAEENGALALDLPHWEMGAIRYVLTGKLVPRLRKLIPKSASFPIGGIEHLEEGEADSTLEPMLGGGISKRHDVRHSPVVVGLEGVARLRSVLDPGSPARRRGADAAIEALLPIGGTLYDLEVTRVHWSIDRRGWDRFERQAAPLVGRAAALVVAGDLGGAAAELDRYLARLRKRFPDLESRIPAYAEMGALGRQLREAADRLGADATPASRKAACERLSGQRVEESGVAAVRKLDESLQECAGSP